MRPERLVVVLGTGTGVGKTWVSAKVLARLKAGGASVAARKPVQSSAACDIETDAHLLGLATGEPAGTVCPPHRRYAVAMAPPIAAAFLGTAAPALEELLAELSWPEERVDVGVVETAGGPRSPIAADADSAALAFALHADLAVLVAHAGLGAINAVRLCAPTMPEPFVVYLNRFDKSDLHDRNRRWLQVDGFDVVVDLAELARRVGDR
ncbi:MAG TPA: dethiobiotin synthase [Acidimicrobiales bacterium]|nr:dethiobiotin synthase [Acidimicrobiales bacterium]